MLYAERRVKVATAVAIVKVAICASSSDEGRSPSNSRMPMSRPPSVEEKGAESGVCLLKVPPPATPGMDKPATREHADPVTMPICTFGAYR